MIPSSVTFGVLLCYVVFSVTSNITEYSDDDYDEYDDYSELNFTTNGTLQFVKELSNITRHSGKTVKLLCEVKNTDPNITNKVRFKWSKNSAILDESNKRITIKNTEKPELQLYSSRLQISKVDLFDKGFYECTASNGVVKIQSIGVLDVTNGKWGSSTSDLATFKQPEFDEVHSHSVENDITTFFPNTQKNHLDESISTLAIPILPTLSEQTIRNPILFEKTAETVPEKTSLKYNISQKFCQIYTGSTCKNFLHEKYVFVQPPYTQESIEKKLENAFIVVNQSNEISSSCSKFAIPSLCFSAFPICVDPDHINTYQKSFVNKFQIEKDANVFKNLRNKLLLQRICKEECILLEKELCKREYSIAKRHPVISQPLELDECEFLPNETDKASMYCLSLGIKPAQSINLEENCYWGNGEQYRGIVDVSISGYKCIKWSQQSNLQLSEYPELFGHSYCRNPDHQELEPFCYTDKNKRESCGLQKCVNVWLLYSMAFGGPAIIIIVIITVWLYCNKQKKSKQTRLQNMNVPSADKNIYGNPTSNSPMELNALIPTGINNMPPRSQSSHRNGFNNVPHYTYKEVALIQELGEGAFGKVYKGDLKTKSGKVTVAVKSLKENASAKTQADFQREIELISELKHPNIICLLGVVVKQEPMCMLFEYMSEGDLHEFLILNSPGEGKSITQHQFLHIALQIAQGMDYLSENHYVHRDLAARNCLVSQDFTVKISDFGLSRDMYSCDYYRVQSKSLLPVRWMPPESILYGKFTTESDVWSYGVVLWEIYSYGLQPYYGYNNQEVINMIRSRKLLPCPDACPSYCYVLMVECWAELAIRRPSFTEIVHRLTVWKQNGSFSGAYFKIPEVHTNLPTKHSSKSSRMSDSLSVDPSSDNQNLRKTSSNQLNESQSSLTSHSSSLGNKTQSTNLSNDNNVRNSRKYGDRKSQKGIKGDISSDGLNPKNTIVNTYGDSFETKLTL